MHGDDVTAGGGCGAHCAVRQGSSGSADSATCKFWGSREQPATNLGSQQPVIRIRPPTISTLLLQTKLTFATPKELRGLQLCIYTRGEITMPNGST
eukprot:SAG25_NODE_247_length_11077_cov_5.635088_11_plen_96_part_00